MTEHEHTELREAIGLYVLGALGADERALLEAHVRTCEACAAEVVSLGGVVDALPHAVPLVEPPASLRQRVLAAAGAQQPAATLPFPNPSSTPDARAAAPRAGNASAWAGWLAAAAMLLAAVGAGLYARTLQHQLDDAQGRLVEAVARLRVSEARLAEATQDATTARASLALLTAPDAVDLKLAGQGPAARASGRAFISRSRGVLFAATQLPALPENRTYQLWYLTRGAPVSAGLVKPDPQGNVTTALPVAADAPAEPAGFAVSIEPDGGVPAPTGAIVLVTQ